MSRPRSIEARLTAAQVTLDKALSDPSLQPALSAFGYNTHRLQEGRALYETALALQEKQKVQHGKLSSAIEACTAAQEQANATYMYHVKMARIVIRDDRKGLRRLGLAGPRKSSRAGWMQQVERFYSNILFDTALLSKLATYNLTKDKLEAGKQQLDAVQATDNTRLWRKIDAQVAIKARNAALKAMDVWMRDFRTIARLALKGQPELLEKLDMTVRSYSDPA